MSLAFRDADKLAIPFHTGELVVLGAVGALFLPFRAGFIDDDAIRCKPHATMMMVDTTWRRV